MAEDYGIQFTALLAAATQNTAAAYANVPGISNAIEQGTRMAVKLSYVQAFRLVYLVAIAFGACAITASFCTVSTDKGKKNNTLAAPLMNVSETQRNRAARAEV